MVDSNNDTLAEKKERLELLKLRRDKLVRYHQLIRLYTYKDELAHYSLDDQHIFLTGMRDELIELQDYFRNNPDPLQQNLDGLEAHCEEDVDFLDKVSETAKIDEEQSRFRNALYSYSIVRDYKSIARIMGMLGFSDMIPDYCAYLRDIPKRGNRHNMYNVLGDVYNLIFNKKRHKAKKFHDFVVLHSLEGDQIMSDEA